MTGGLLSQILRCAQDDREDAQDDREDAQDDKEGFCCPRSFAALRMTGGSDGKFEPSGFLFIDQRNDLSDTG